MTDEPKDRQEEGPEPAADETEGAGQTTGGPDTPGSSTPPGAEASAASAPEGAGTVPPPPYEPPVGAPSAPWHNRLMRRPEGKVIAGVCSGLGAYTGTDPVLWRIGFVVLTLAGGSGILAYIVAWLVMPEARPGEPLPDRPQHDSQKVGQWVAIGAIAIGALLIFRGIFDFNQGWFWGLLLIGIGVAIWGRDLTGGRPPPYRPVPPAPQNPSDRWSWAASQTPTNPNPPAVSPGPPAGGAPTSPFTTTATTPLPPRPAVIARREPSILGRVVIGAAALAIGIGLLLDNLNVLRLTPRGMFAVLLAIVGLGLLVGSRWGRARWLIFPGIALACLLAIASIIPVHAKGGWGDIAWRPSSLRTLQPAYEHSAGQAVLDLTDLDFGERPRDIDVRLGFGELMIVVPEDLDVVVDAHVQGGELTLFGGTQNDGWDVRNYVTDTVEKGDGPLEIDADVTFGELTVRRGDTSDADNLINQRGDFDFRMGNQRFFRNNEGG